MEVIFVLSALTVLLLGSDPVDGGKCPPNPAGDMQKCAEQIRINLNIAESHKFFTDAELTNLMCEGGEVTKAITCMETIYNDCKASGIVDKDLMIKPVAWKAGVKLLCKNRKFLLDNTACVEKSKADMVSCVDKHSKAAEAEINVKGIDMASKGKDKQRKIFKLVCGLSKKLIGCFDATLHKNCPKKMEELVNDVFYMFLPPVCHPENPSYLHVKDGEEKVDDDDDDDGKNGRGGTTSTLTTSSFFMATLMLCLSLLL